MADFVSGLGAKPNLDPRAMQMVLDAMLRQNGAVPMGAPSVPPNFTMPGYGTGFNPNILSGQGTFPLGSQGALVPRAPAGLPTAPMIDVTPKAAVPGLEGLGGAATEAGAAETTAAKATKATKLSKAGLLKKGVKGVSRVAIPAMIAGAPFAMDNGEINATPGSWAAGLADEEDDLGVTSVGKSWMRGNYNAAKWLADNAVLPVYDAVVGLGQTAAERADIDKLRTEQSYEGQATNALNAQGGPVPLYGNGGQPVAYGGGQPDLSGLEWVIPGAGTDNTGAETALDNLLKVIEAQKPTKASVPENFSRDMQNLAFLKALDWGQPTDMTGLSRALTGVKGAELQAQLQGLDLEKAYGDQMKDWLETYAKTSVDVEKEKRNAKKDDFKIHTTRNGFLVEMNEGGKKVLKPISTAIFGGDKKEERILGPEMDLIDQLEQAGQLGPILAEHGKDLAEYTKGLTDPKEIQQALKANLAVAIRKSPEFKASLQQKFLDAVGQPQQVPSVPASDEDWLTTITKGR